MIILVVDDNAQVRQLIRREVADLVTQVYESGDGAAVLALYQCYRPDWVVMDLALKQANGLSVTRQLTAAFPQARVCLVTTYDDDFLRDAALAAGACGFVNKENLVALRALIKESMPSAWDSE